MPGPMSSSTLSKVLVQWLQQLATPFRPLSRNIRREVCLYLSTRFLVPAVKNSTLRVYDLDHRTVTEGQLTRTITTASVPVMINYEVVMYVGGHPPYTSDVCSVNIVTFQVTVLRHMLEARGWAGVIKYTEFVYVFGGNNPQLASAEKYDIERKRWIWVPGMRHARYSFTPALYKKEIYLADCMINPKVIEVFNPYSETYRELEVVLPQYGTHSLSFVLDSEFYLISYTFQGGKLPLEPQPTAFLDISLTHINKAMGYLGSPPLILEKMVYFAHYTEGILTVYDVERQTLSTIDEFSP